jgi:hypothetical protein
VEVAEYDVSKNLHDSPDFVWWVPNVLKNRSRIIDAMTKTYHNLTHKFGIEVPKSWDECVRLYTYNGNTLWQDTIRNEMKNVRVAFTIMNGEQEIPPTDQEIRCHRIFDVNMEDC